jgi:hypothetical protein
VTFDRADEVPPGIGREKLAMNNVNVFACVEDLKLFEPLLLFAIMRAADSGR